MLFNYFRNPVTSKKKDFDYTHPPFSLLSVEQSQAMCYMFNITCTNLSDTRVQVDIGRKMLKKYEEYGKNVYFQLSNRRPRQLQPVCITCCGCNTPGSGREQALVTLPCDTSHDTLRITIVFSAWKQLRSNKASGLAVSWNGTIFRTLQYSPSLQKQSWHLYSFFSSSSFLA